MKSFKCFCLNKSLYKEMKKNKRGLFATRETEKQKKIWNKGEQQRFRDTKKVKIYVKSLNLQENENGIYISKGIIEGAHPTYLPKESLHAQKIILAEHNRTLDWGVTFTMTSVKPRYWIPSQSQ